MIPTFIGTTLLVFTILQVAPDGPFERAVKQLKEAQGAGGEGGGSSSNLGGSNEITEDLLEQMRMQYGLDKPILVRYAIWLGVWPKEIKNKSIPLNEDFRETIHSVEINQFKEYLLQRYVKVIKEDDQLQVIETGVGLEFEMESKDKLISNYNIDESRIDAIEFYRENYDELPNNASYIKTWYFSDWKISNSENEKGEITLVKKTYQGILSGFLGYSQMRGKNVSELIKERLHISIIFGLSGFLLSYLICIPLGISKAIRHGSKFDIISSSIVFIGYSIPGYALGVLLLSIWGGDIFPMHGWRSVNFSELTFLGKVWDQIHHAFLPVLCYTIGSFATLTVLMKNSLMENLSQDYVRTAFSKGLSEKKVILYHAVRNSLIPIATGIGSMIGLFLAGSYLIEMVFGIDGIGMLGLQALLDRDYNIIMGNLVIFTLIRLFGNLISDLTYAFIDPRIRFK
tara:strand:- start:504 stop:1871 length:1368 start_codon:yes stop_codon:yes gene_type:complete